MAGQGFPRLECRGRIEACSQLADHVAQFMQVLHGLSAVAALKRAEAHRHDFGS